MNDAKTQSTLPLAGNNASKPQTTKPPAKPPELAPAPTATKPADTAPQGRNLAQLTEASLKARNNLISTLESDNPTVAQIESAVAALPPNLQVRALASTLIGLHQRDVTRIGQGQAFVRRGATSNERMIVVPVKLSLARGQLYQVTENVKENGQWVKRVVGDPRRALLTFEGFNECNKAAGIILVQPQTIKIDGVDRSNPYEDRDRRGEVTRRVYEVVAMGRSAITGNPAIVTYRVTEEASVPLVMGLASIIDKADDSAKPPAKYVAPDAPTPQGWGRIAANYAADIIFNLDSKPVKDLFNKRAKASEHAGKKIITTAKRNALREHAGLGIRSVLMDKHGEAIVPVYCWQTDPRTDEAFETAKNAIANGATLEQLSSLQNLIPMSSVAETRMISEQMDASDDDNSINIADPQAVLDEDDMIRMHTDLTSQVEALLGSASADVRAKVGDIKADASISDLEKMRDLLLAAMPDSADGEE